MAILFVCLSLSSVILSVSSDTHAVLYRAIQCILQHQKAAVCDSDIIARALMLLSTVAMSNCQKKLKVNDKQDGKSAQNPDQTNKQTYKKKS